jgi:hypothetical protein
MKLLESEAKAFIEHRERTPDNLNFTLSHLPKAEKKNWLDGYAKGS